MVPMRRTAVTQRPYRRPAECLTKMTLQSIGQFRLASQRIIASDCRTPVALVTALGAVQAQDYAGALWAIGLRLPAASEVMIEQSIAERSVLRTWPMRGTLHFIPAADARWMLELLTPRIIAGSAGRCRQLELDAKIFTRSRKLFVRALQRNRQLTRDEMMELLTREGISVDGQRGYHILWRLAQEGVICLAARDGKQHTFALFEEWVSHSNSLDREAALAELARRYFNGHGPATLADFAWWSGLKVSDAKAGLESIASTLSRQEIEGTVYWMPRELPDRPNSSPAAHLLPSFDEYLLGYTDRSAVLPSRWAKKITPVGNGRFSPIVVINGRVAGTWGRTLKKKSIVITIDYFQDVSRAEKQAVANAAEDYAAFSGLPVEAAKA